MGTGDADDDRSALQRVLQHDPSGRLRAGWRLAVWLVVLLIAVAVGAVAFEALATVAVGPAVLAAALAVAGGVAFYAVPTGATLAMARFVDRRPLASLGLGGAALPRNLGFGLALGLVMTTTVFLVELALGLVTVEGVLVVDPSAPVVPLAALGGPTAAGVGAPVLLVGLAIFFLAVGVGEEVLVRGYVLTNLAEGVAGLGPVDDRRAAAIAIVATSALFGALHLSNPNASALAAVNIALVGGFLGWTYAASGDLGIPIGVHVAWNLSLSAGFGYPVSGLETPVTVLDVAQTGDPLLTGGRFGPEGGLVTYLALAVAIGFTWWWLRRRDGPRPIGAVARYAPGSADRPNHDG